MFTNEVIATFNDLEMLIYKYVMQHKEKVIYMRIRDLADEAHVSTSTIMRFCRKLNCEGFSEFKVKLKLAMDEKRDTPIKSGQHVVAEFLERTQNENFTSKLEDAADAISKANHVYFIGIGSSGTLAEYGARYFSSLGTFSTYLKDWYTPIHANLNNSITIALSVSGENQFTISHIHQLKDKNSKILSITNNGQSTIAKISDKNVSYYVSEEFFETSNITTQIPVIFILEELARRVYEKSRKSD
ncbi:MurR/RpiR family transcriptional regulator [Metabacillus sediminilitoris]|uniref:MurR/RpiR family transcriptional regulator n=1 Tax=Metabacillus sediminilitoris TaxID=2567941 RepID=A0A4S4BUR7_9BACI|nr:MurR/RpiR family transcriptional regulator [Metabacillus sediminilitoris]QGQ44793.1 SIS domain-containing protein [Metabacillus sediminilitoris]THF78859.1 MurR/RpiR family transcriptional regulator [Metabacillus sediminilitoris]